MSRYTNAYEMATPKASLAVGVILLRYATDQRLTAFPPTDNRSFGTGEIKQKMSDSIPSLHNLDFSSYGIGPASSSFAQTHWKYQKMCRIKHWVKYMRNTGLPKSYSQNNTGHDSNWLLPLYNRNYGLTMRYLHGFIYDARNLIFFEGSFMYFN